MLASKGEAGSDGETRIYRYGSPAAVKLAAEVEQIKELLQDGTATELPTILYAVSVTKGQPVYIDATDGKAYLAKADDAATAKVAGLAADDVTVGNVGPLCVDSVVTQLDWSNVLESGSVLIPGGVLYLSAATAGRLSFVPPSTTGQYVCRVATCLSTSAAEVEVAQSILL